MASRFEIKIVTQGLPKITKNEVYGMKRRGLTAAGRAWHIRISPTKFTPTGASKYRFTPRKTKNIFNGTVRKTKRGKELAPSGLPLVWSGRSAVLARARTIRANSKRARVSVPVRIFNIRRPHNADPRMDMLREWRATTRQDDRMLAKVARGSIRDELKRNKKRVTVVV